MEVLGYTIVPNIDSGHPPKVHTLLEKALKKIALDSTKAAQTAEALIQEALDICPDDPLLLNNLAVAYEIQERYEEAEQLTLSLIENHPDDVMGCISMMQIYLNKGDMEAAASVCQPILKRQQFTVDEFASFALGYSNFLVQKGERDIARRWLQGTVFRLPDHDLFSQFANLVNG